VSNPLYYNNIYINLVIYPNHSTVYLHCTHWGGQSYKSWYIVSFKFFGISFTYKKKYKVYCYLTLNYIENLIKENSYISDCLIWT